MARPVASKTFKRTVLSGALGLWVAILSYAQPSHAQINTFPLSYSGRLTASGGEPLPGPIDIQLRFWVAFSGGTALSDSFDFSSVVLNQGVFQIRIAASSDQIEDIFGDGTKTVFVEVTAKGVTYPRQEFTFIPLALRVPVDNKTILFTSDGKLKVAVPARTSPTSVLSIDNQGKFT